jgi:hypothetical protein
VSFRRRLSPPQLFALVLSGILFFHFAGFIDRATPSLVDDHDIIAPLGSSATAPLSDVLTDLKQTDDFRALAETGKAARFRPAHYPFKSLQIYLFGNNIRLWYIAAFAIYVATATVLFALVYRSFGLTIGILFAVIYFGHRAWADIMPRLGTVELDCILIGTPLIYLCWRWIREDRASWMILLVGPLALIYGATKEPNSVFLIAIGALMSVCGAILAHRRMAIAGTVCMICGAIVLMILVKTTPSAEAGLIGLRPVLQSYLRHWHHDVTAWITIALLAALGVAAFQKRRGELEIDGRELVAMTLAVSSIEALRLSIFYLTYGVTYNGQNDPIAMRYGYAIFVMTSLVAAIVLGRLSQLPDQVVALRTRRYAAACLIALLLVNQGLLARKTLASRDAWQTFNASTEETIRAAAAWLAAKRQGGVNPTLLVTGPTLEWEPRLSLIMFLRHRMPGTPVYFDPTEPSEKRGTYLRESIRYGGRPIESRPDPADCIDLHVDTLAYESRFCRASLTIIKPI